MWRNGRGLSALVIAMLWASSCFGSTCSEKALRTFSAEGVDAAFAHFHKLLEDKLCRDESEFLVNFAQAYRSQSSSPDNSCRANMAYNDALKKRGLLPAYVRVARKGIEQTKYACDALRETFAKDEARTEHFLIRASRLVRDGAYQLALREYRLLMVLMPTDQRPVRGLCKAARMAHDEEVLAFCRNAKRQRVDLEPARNTNGEAQPSRTLEWVATTATIALAGVSAWHAHQMFQHYDDAVAANRAAKVAIVEGDRMAFDLASTRERSAGDATRASETNLIIFGSITGVAAITSAILWYRDDGVQAALSTSGELILRAQF